MTTRKQVTLNTVYEVLPYKAMNAQNPSFTVKGGEVNVYHFNKTKPSDSLPANKTTMTPNQDNAYAEGTYEITGDTDAILFESESGSPVVTTKNIVR